MQRFCLHTQLIPYSHPEKLQSLWKILQNNINTYTNAFNKIVNTSIKTRLRAFEVFWRASRNIVVLKEHVSGRSPNSPIALDTQCELKYPRKKKIPGHGYGVSQITPGQPARRCPGRRDGTCGRGAGFPVTPCRLASSQCAGRRAAGHEPLPAPLGTLATRHRRLDVQRAARRQFTRTSRARLRAAV